METLIVSSVFRAEHARGVGRAELEMFRAEHLPMEETVTICGAARSLRLRGVHVVDLMR
jgi:hypothetical protein